MPWTIVANPVSPEKPELPTAALTAAPPEVAAGGGALLPRGPMEGHCRICGIQGRLTKEHLPPASARNKGQFIAHDLDDWFTSDGDLEATKGQVKQGGLFGRTLCANCNNVTGSWYADEYRRWSERAGQIFAQLPPLSEIDARPEPLGLEVSFESVDCGAFVRQCLSVMCSLSGPWDIAGRHPEIQDFVLRRQVGALPPGLDLGLALYAGPLVRAIGPTVSVDRETGEWRWLLEMAFPPLVVLLVLAGAPLDYPMFGIGEFTRLPPGKLGHLEFDLPVAFGHTPYPSDYRTAGEMMLDHGSVPGRSEA